MHDRSTITAAPTARRRKAWQLALLVVLPIALAITACNPIDEVTDFFGLTDHEVATPEFVIQNGIKVMATINAPAGLDGTTITVRLRCAGGSTLTETITLHKSGTIATGTTTFDQTGWNGVDCVVSQEIVQGVEVVRAVIQQLGGGDIFKGIFTNQ